MGFYTELYDFVYSVEAFISIVISMKVIYEIFKCERLEGAVRWVEPYSKI